MGVSLKKYSILRGAPRSGALGTCPVTLRH